MKVQFKDLSKGHDCPILIYCRGLIKRGINPNTRLECYRGEQLDVIIHNIGLAAKLEVSNGKFQLQARVVA